MRGAKGFAGAWAALACGAVMVLAPAPASASSVVIPQDPGWTIAASGQYSHVGQTITVPAAPVTDNFWHTLTFNQFDYNPGGPTSFKVYITGTSGGFPNVPPSGPYLFESAPISIPRSGPLTVYPNITVTPGTQYAVFFDNGNSTPSVGSAPSGPYAGGNIVAYQTSTSSWGSPNMTTDVALQADFSAPSLATNTAVNCTPNPVVISSTSNCTATVTNAVPGPATPTGTVGFTGGVNCTLTAGSCSAAVPTGGSTGTFPVTATYSGDSTHLGSSGVFQLTRTARSTSTTAACIPSNPKVSQISTCTATVADTASGTQSTPTGMVIFTVSGAGDLAPSTCLLSAGSCNVTYTPNAAGPATIFANYAPDTSAHELSSGNTTVTGVRRTTATSISCAPANLEVGQVASCTATITDTDPVGTPSAPAGDVDFSVGGAGGTLSASNCVAPAGSCSFTFTPTAAGSSTITGDFLAVDNVHDDSSGNGTVTAVNATPPTTPPTPVSGAVDTPDVPCPDISQKLKRLKKKLERQKSGAGDSKKKAKKRAKIRKNIKDTKKRKKQDGC